MNTTHAPVPQPSGLPFEAPIHTPDWVIREALQQILTPRSHRADHWQVVVLLGTTDQISVALGTLITALCTRPDDDLTLDFQRLRYDSSARQATQKHPQTRLTIYDGNPFLRERGKTGALNAETHFALTHLGTRGVPRQRAVCTGEAFDYRGLKDHHLPWLDGLILLLPLWCRSEDEAGAQIQTARATPGVLKDPVHSGGVLL